MLYMVTFIINIPQMLAYIPYMDPMGIISGHQRDNISLIDLIRSTTYFGTTI